MAQDLKTRAILAQLSDTHGGTRVYVPKRKPISNARIKEARAEGKTCAEIARELGCHKSTISRRMR
ncbi:helix-turn-helix domain-containing protein [Methylomagnum ishizawai]|uniref:helix-turn-helix domain-containing protein n=1 Tax=Methylomagnum ishizawai TaxID=1760988 RepID=UPI003CCE7CA0